MNGSRRTCSRWTKIFLPSVEFSDLLSSPSDLPVMLSAPKCEALKQAHFRHRQHTFSHANVQGNAILRIAMYSCLEYRLVPNHSHCTPCPILSIMPQQLLLLLLLQECPGLRQMLPPHPALVEHAGELTHLRCAARGGSYSPRH